MKILKATIFNIDQENRNGRRFSKQVLDDAMVDFCERPLYLSKDLPPTVGMILPESGPKAEDIIGVGLHSAWSDNDTKLTHTFKLYEDRVENIDFTKVYPAMYGNGNLDEDGNISSFNLLGFGLCEYPAFETEVEILDVDVNRIYPHKEESKDE